MCSDAHSITLNIYVYMQLCCLLLSIVSKMYILKRRRKYMALKCDKVVHTRHNGIVSYIM